MGINSPCKGCTKRVLHCHSNCSEYSQYKVDYAKCKEAKESYQREREIGYTSRVRAITSRKI